MPRATDRTDAVRASLLQAYASLPSIDCVSAAFNEDLPTPYSVVGDVIRQGKFDDSAVEAEALQQLEAFESGCDHEALEAIAGLRYAYTVQSLRGIASFQREFAIPVRRAVVAHLAEAEEYRRQAAAAHRFNMDIGSTLNSPLWLGQTSASH